MRVYRCRSCEAMVIWATSVNGKSMPLDEAPSPEGTFSIEENDRGDVLATYHPKGSQPNLFTSHFGTCPDAEIWRRE